MRFVAPPRGTVDSACFDHPVFAAYARHLDLLRAEHWPALDELDRRMGAVDPGIRFVRQDAALLADGHHYETRIAATGRVATRPDNWHDLLNALVWMEYPALKRALNARQVADIGIVGRRERTRGQCALTHFDEAGIVVVMPDASLLPAWDRHDWSTLFLDGGSAWRHRIHIHVFGHALLEHALYPQPWLVGKAMVVLGDDPWRARDTLVSAIRSGQVLNDPLELRPLPLAGVPGWHPRAGTVDFYHDAPCFQPVREGRRYPPPLPVT